jgi:hypothetical protein
MMEVGFFFYKRALDYVDIEEATCRDKILNIFVQGILEYIDV